MLYEKSSAVKNRLAMRLVRKKSAAKSSATVTCPLTKSFSCLNFCERPIVCVKMWPPGFSLVSPVARTPFAYLFRFALKVRLWSPVVLRLASDLILASPGVNL